MTHMNIPKAAAFASAIATLAMLALPTAASAADAAGNWAAISKCAAIGDDSARLICMDAVLSSAGVSQAQSSAATPPTVTQNIPEALAPAPARQQANLSPQQREDFFPDDKAGKTEDKVTEIEVTLASVQAVSGKKYVLTDSDGVVWRQLYTPTSRIPPKPGQSMSVQKNALGGYLCRVESTPSFRCKPAS